MSKFFKSLLLLGILVVSTFFTVLSCKKTNSKSDTDSTSINKDDCHYTDSDYKAKLKSISSTVPTVFIYSSKIAAEGGKIDFFSDEDLEQAWIKITPFSSRAKVTWLTDQLNENAPKFSQFTITSCDQKTVNTYNLMRSGELKKLSGLASLKLNNNQTFFLKDIEINTWASVTATTKTGRFIAANFPTLVNEFVYEHIAGSGIKDADNKVQFDVDPTGQKIKIEVNSLDNSIKHTYTLDFISTVIDMKNVKKVLKCGFYSDRSGHELYTGIGEGTEVAPLEYSTLPKYCSIHGSGSTQNFTVTNTVHKDNYVIITLEDVKPYVNSTLRVYVKQKV